MPQGLGKSRRSVRATPERLSALSTLRDTQSVQNTYPPPTAMAYGCSLRARVTICYEFNIKKENDLITICFNIYPTWTSKLMLFKKILGLNLPVGAIHHIWRVQSYLNVRRPSRVSARRVRVRARWASICP